jgi:hypothetical protein
MRFVIFLFLLCLSTSIQAQGYVVTYNAGVGGVPTTTSYSLSATSATSVKEKEYRMSDSVEKLMRVYIEGNSYAWGAFSFLLYAIGMSILMGVGMCVYTQYVAVSKKNK